MIILNGEHGYQEGWVELDHETFFIDLSIIPFGFYDRIFEITRPPVMLTFVPYQVDYPQQDPRKAPYSFTLEDGDPPKEFVYPGLGM